VWSVCPSLRKQCFQTRAQILLQKKGKALHTKELNSNGYQSNFFSKLMLGVLFTACVYFPYFLMDLSWVCDRPRGCGDTHTHTHTHTHAHAHTHTHAHEHAHTHTCICSVYAGKLRRCAHAWLATFLAVLMW